jgi:hypothetical protein
MNHDRRICRVGYAMNAKKLRRSASPSGPVTASRSCGEVGTPGSPAVRNKPWSGGGLADIFLSQPSDTETEDESQEEIVRFSAFSFDDVDDLNLSSVKEFQVLIHKLTDDIEKGDPVDRLRSMQCYLLSNKCVLVDPFDAVHLVTSRVRTCNLLQSIIDKQLIPSFSIPKFGLLNKKDDLVQVLQENNITFPVICKPVEACGTPSAHSMVCVFVFFSCVSIKLTSSCLFIF